MIKYGINVKLLEKLIDKTIIDGNDLFSGHEINVEDNGRMIYVFVTFYFNNSNLGRYEDEYYSELTRIYGDLGNISDNEYDDFNEYVRNELIYKPIHKLMFTGMGLDKKKYRLSVETVE
jgi:hypothetical protein